MNPSTPFNNALASARMRSSFALGQRLLNFTEALGRGRHFVGVVAEQGRFELVALGLQRAAAALAADATIASTGRSSVEGARVSCATYATRKWGGNPGNAPAAMRRKSVDLPTPLRPSSA